MGMGGGLLLASGSMAALWTGSSEHSVSHGKGGEVGLVIPHREPPHQLRIHASCTYRTGEGAPSLASRPTAVAKEGPSSGQNMGMGGGPLTGLMLHGRVLDGFVGTQLNLGLLGRRPAGSGVASVTSTWPFLGLGGSSWLPLLGPSGATCATPTGAPLGGMGGWRSPSTDLFSSQWGHFPVQVEGAIDGVFLQKK